MDILFGYLNPKKVIDIGANIGDFTRNIHYIFPKCDIIMVEANPNCKPYLSLLGKPYEIITLSDSKKDNVDLYIEKVNPIGTGGSLYKENTEWYSEGKYNIIKVNTNTLDSRNYFLNEKIDLIKIDTQGSEYDILMGGLNTIKRTEFVLVEASLVEYNQGSPLVGNTITLMKENDFYIEDIIEYHSFPHLYNNAIFQIDILFKNKKSII